MFYIWLVTHIITLAQQTATYEGDPAVLQAKGRHDPVRTNLVLEQPQPFDLFLFFF